MVKHELKCEWKMSYSAESIKGVSTRKILLVCHAPPPHAESKSFPSAINFLLALLLR